MAAVFSSRTVQSAGMALLQVTSAVTPSTRYASLVQLITMSLGGASVLRRPLKVLVYLPSAKTKHDDQASLL